jgi:hypothetical protein
MIIVLSGAWAVAYGVYCMIRVMFAVAFMAIGALFRFVINCPKSATVVGAVVAMTWLILHAAH